MEWLSKLAEKKIKVAQYYYGLTSKGWKFDIEESDLFVQLSKTFWKDGLKVSLILEQFSCVPPIENEFSTIKELSFYSFSPQKYPQRTIPTLFEDLYKEVYYQWKNVEDYMSHLERNYPDYLHFGDLNTTIYYNDDKFLKRLSPEKVSEFILQEVKEDIEKTTASQF